jgi:hypothetical protein
VPVQHCLSEKEAIEGAHDIYDGKGDRGIDYDLGWTKPRYRGHKVVWFDQPSGCWRVVMGLEQAPDVSVPRRPQYSNLH